MSPSSIRRSTNSMFLLNLYQTTNQMIDKCNSHSQFQNSSHKTIKDHFKTDILQKRALTEWASTKEVISSRSWELSSWWSICDSSLRRRSFAIFRLYQENRHLLSWSEPIDLRQLLQNRLFSGIDEHLQRPKLKEKKTLAEASTSIDTILKSS